MSDTDRPKRTGRPPRFPEEGARVQLSVRLKRSIDQALRVAADRNSRSLAEEVEFRLNQSFEGIVVSVDAQTLSEIKTEAERKSVTVSEIASTRITEFPHRKSFSDIVTSGDFSEYISEQIHNSSVIARLRDERASEASLSAELDHIDSSIKSLREDLFTTNHEIKAYEDILQGKVDDSYRESISSIISSRRIAVYVLEMRISENERSREVAHIRFIDARDRVKASMQECRERNLLDRI